MPVGTGAVTSGALNNGSLTTTQSFVSTNQPLYVAVNYWTGPTTGITYAGQALTKVSGSTASNGTDFAEIWRLLSPPAGTANLVITFGGTNCPGSFCVFNTTGQNTTTPEGTAAHNQSGANGTTTGSLAISGAATGDLTLVSVCNGGGAAVTPSASGGGAASELYDLASNAEEGEAFVAADTTTSVSGSWTGSTSWAIAAIPLKASAATTPTWTSLPRLPVWPASPLVRRLFQQWQLQQHLSQPAPPSTVGAWRDAPGRFSLVIPSGVQTILPTTTLGRVKGATGGVAQRHLVYASNTGRWWFFTYKGLVDTGTATSGSTSQLTDTSKSWTAGQFLGMACMITGGTGAGQCFIIGNNTATSLPVVDNGATGSWLATALAAGSTYEIVEATKVRAYVSSGADLSTATWSEATGSPSPSTGDPANTLGYGFNLAGGKNNPGGYGEYPTDGRLLAVGYGNVGGVDVVYMLAQIDSHYIHVTERGRLTAATTVAWDGNVHGGGGGSGWNDQAPGIEDAPDFPQSLAMGFSSTGRWWWINEENFQPIIGYTAGVVDNGLANQDPAWSGTNGAGKPSTWDTALTSIGAPWQGAVIPLASGFMLAVYCSGTEAGSTPSAGNTRQGGLRFAESASATAWPATNVGAAVPNLSATNNHPNDWGICRVSDTDIHVVRRNGATALEHVRYSGHGGSWGAKVNLPTTGLTGHQAGSGVAMVSDGTTVWCFVVDTDANHSVRYAKWTLAGGWDSSWSTLTTDSGTKDFLIAEISPTGIGVAWTRGSGPYEVDVAWLSVVTTNPGFRDASGRFRLLANAVRDAPGRFRLAVAATRDAAGRFRVAAPAWRDAAGRFRLVATGWRDAPGRFRLQVAALHDSAGRFRLLATSTRDAAGRFRLLAPTIRDAAGRFHLLSSGWRNAAGRFRLTGQPIRDALGRFRLQVAAWRDGAGRFRLLATGVRDAAGRFRMLATGVRDAAGRFRLSVASVRDALGRFRLLATSARDAAARFRLVVAGIRDASGRFRLAVVATRDGLGRFRFLASTTRDAAGRFRVTILGQAWRDAAGRFRLRATGWRDANGRFLLQVLAFRDAAGRFRLSGLQRRDAAGRFRLLVVSTRDALGRFRLALAGARDAAGRFRLRATGWRDAAGRVRIMVLVARDGPGRFRLALFGTRNASGRHRLLGLQQRDAAGRFRIIAATPGPILRSATRVRMVAGDNIRGGTGSTRIREVA